ncbi:MAG: flavin monoamine oxidase family protein [Pseudonocardiaceae bacterium]
MAQDVLDVAIIGGGVSGVWSGWRLTGEWAGAGRKQRVAVFEASDRIGGRLLSVQLPGLPGVMCELGGMRYMSTQPLVKWLVEDQLGLTPEDAPVAEPHNLAYLRGRRLRQSDLTNPDLVPYDLSPTEKGVSPDALLQNAVAQIVPAIKDPGVDLRKALQDAVYDDRPVYQQGFWNLLARTMSAEAYRFSEEAGGYDTALLNWNGVDTILLNFDFAHGVTFHRIKEGYQEVPLGLARRFEEQGGELRLNVRARSVDSVVLADGTTGVRIELDDTTAGTNSTVFARAAILAMPRRSLELLDPAGAVLGDSRFQDLLTTVTPIPLFKAFVAYHEAWWENVGVSTGRSVTDLPLRQVYYWAPPEPGGNSVLLATYDDTLNVAFWQGLARDPERYGLTLDHLPAQRRAEIEGAAGDSRWEDHRATVRLTLEVHRQLLEMHGVPDAPAPYAAMYRDWSEDPYGGGVNFWNIGAKSWEVIPQMVAPVGDVPVFVCGEAYSGAQGWVEGALQTAELVLTSHLGLDPVPAMLPLTAAGHR